MSLEEFVKLPEERIIQYFKKDENDIWQYYSSIDEGLGEINEQIRSVAFSPDGKYLLSGAFDAKIKIYDINNNFNFIGEIEHGDKVVSCKWHPDIPLIISTSADKTARVWIPSKY